MRFVSYPGPRTRHDDAESIASTRGPQGPLRQLDLHPPFRHPRHLRVYMDRLTRCCVMGWRLKHDRSSFWQFFRVNQVGETLAGPRTSEAFSLRGGVDALLDPGNHFGDEEKPRRLRAVQGLTLDCLRQDAFNSNIFKPVPFACLDAECLRAKSVGCGVTFVCW